MLNFITESEKYTLEQHTISPLLVLVCLEKMMKIKFRGLILLEVWKRNFHTSVKGVKKSSQRIFYRSIKFLSILLITQSESSHTSSYIQAYED